MKACWPFLILYAESGLISLSSLSRLPLEKLSNDPEEESWEDVDSSTPSVKYGCFNASLALILLC